MDFNQVLFNRHSTRSFQEKKVEREKLERILKAGYYAPNAMHENTWQFTLITNENAMTSLAQVIQNALEREAYDFYGAPAILLVSDKKTNPHYLANCAVALENIFLQACEEGLSSVWINQLKLICDEPDVRRVLTALGLPEDHYVGGIAAIGYEKDTRKRAVKEATVKWVE